jgi:ABC-2 type transport system ATP-binding protein
VAEPVIVVEGLRKSYGDHEAVRGIDLTVEHREIFAFLGPNGAGKTTTVEILEGYRKRTSGRVEVLGTDPAHPTAQWRSRVGVVLQELRLSSLLTVKETLDMYAGYYPAPRSVPETIELVGLREQANLRAGRLSGGQQRRLDVALALIGDPELLFLDEPTTGFDPAARRATWEVIAGLRDLGKTVFLTTHYMDEAQRLADRVAILRAGQIIAEGRPGELGGGQRLVTTVAFRMPGPHRLADLPAGLAARVVQQGGMCQLSSEEPTRDLAVLCGWALDQDLTLDDLEVHRPTLEEIYLELTGQDVV